MEVICSGNALGACVRIIKTIVHSQRYKIKRKGKGRFEFEVYRGQEVGVEDFDSPLKFKLLMNT